MTSRKLRFGIVVRSCRTIAAWQAQAIGHLVESGVAELVAMIVDESLDMAGKPSLLWRAFARICRPRAKMREHIRGVAANAVELSYSRDLATVRDLDLDFVIAFTRASIAAAIVTRPRYGVWSFDHGEGHGRRAGPPCFWEICGGSAVTSAVLRCSTAEIDVTTTLRKGYFRVINYSYARSLDHLYFESAKWPAYVAGEIVHGLTPETASEASVSAQRSREPSNAAMLKFFWTLARNALRRLFERAHAEEWSIGIARMEAQELLAGARLKDAVWIPPVRGGWVADPMALSDGTRVIVLCEEMRLRTGKGRISVTAFDGSSWSPLQPVIQTATHASYPCLFDHRGETFCIPETYQANEVALYRAREFPTTWERVGILLSGFPAVDNTLFEHDGLFWLFCTSEEAPNTTLLAFFSEDLLGPWRPHLANPVKIDVRSSRPAGSVFRIGGQLYRPAQDCSRTYGGRVIIHRVTELTPTVFREESCATVDPQLGTRYELGLHTLSFAGGYCVLDGKRRVLRPFGLLRAAL